MDHASRVTGTRTPAEALSATAGTVAARAHRLRALADDLDTPHRDTPPFAAPRLAGLTRGHAAAVDDLAATLRAAGAAAGPTGAARRPHEPRTAG